MPYPRKATPELLERLEQIVEMRLAIPSDKQLAYETGFSEKLIQRWMTYLRRKRVNIQRSTWSKP